MIFPTTFKTKFPRTNILTIINQVNSLLLTSEMTVNSTCHLRERRFL